MQPCEKKLPPEIATSFTKLTSILAFQCNEAQDEVRAQVMELISMVGRPDKNLQEAIAAVRVMLAADAIQQQIKICLKKQPDLDEGILLKYLIGALKNNTHDSTRQRIKVIVQTILSNTQLMSFKKERESRKPATIPDADITPLFTGTTAGGGKKTTCRRGSKFTS